MTEKSHFHYSDTVKKSRVKTDNSRTVARCGRASCPEEGVRACMHASCHPPEEQEREKERERAGITRVSMVGGVEAPIPARRTHKRWTR